MKPFKFSIDEIKKHKAYFVKLLLNGEASKLLNIGLENDIALVPGATIESLKKINPRLPSILIISLPRSGSTYLQNSLIKSFGYIGIPEKFSSTNTETLSIHFYWLKINGLISRVHNLPTDQVIKSINAVSPGKIIFLQRNSIDAAFSLFVRQYYNPRKLDKKDQKNILEENTLVDKFTFFEFMNKTILENDTFLKSWERRISQIEHNITVLQYEHLYQNTEESFQKLSNDLGLRKTLTPIEKSIISNWQVPLSTRLRSRYQTWIDEIINQTE